MKPAGLFVRGVHNSAHVLAGRGWADLTAYVEGYSAQVLMRATWADSRTARWHVGRRPAQYPARTADVVVMPSLRAAACVRSSCTPAACGPRSMTGKIAIRPLR
jgi:hypothetical protein